LVKALERVLTAIVAARMAARKARRSAKPSEPPPESDGAGPSGRIVPSNRRAETGVALLLILAALFGFGFVAVYVVFKTNAQWLGGMMGGMLLCLAAAGILAGKKVVPQEVDVEERDALLKPEQAQEVVAMLESGGEGVSRRKLLFGAGGLAGAAFVTAAATPIASIGPALQGIHSTPWHRGVRLVDDHGRPYLASEIEVGSLYTALPEGEFSDWEKLPSGLIMVKLPAHYLHLPAARRGWAPQGIVAYTKICPHAGCAISLYRYPTFAPTSVAEPAFTCPCHYSTFLPGEGGRLIFGPAGRALSQLPLMIDNRGYVRAAGHFHEDVGPSWWNVHRSQS
jgi:ubiquinol-cytochrome c reductase iron-sulfur subunit